MSQLSFSSFDSSLMVRDAQGRYLLATAEQILEAARQAIERKMQRGTSFTSPAAVKEYLRAKLAGFERVKEALRLNAAAVIVSHNHPSGNPEPSGADRALTQRLKEALGLVDVRVLDHVIVAGTDTTSFAERGLI